MAASRTSARRPAAETVARSVLLDLDGTLVDPKAGILGGYRHTLTTLGRDVPEDDQLTWVIGPALRLSFARLLGPDADIEAAVALYRGYYSSRGLYEASVYPGIIEALAHLRSAGWRLMICTAKVEAYARRMAGHFGLAALVDGIYGADPAGTLDDKAVLMRHLLHSEGLDPADAVMVGDRKFDCLAASANGVASVGVLWGYGSLEELTEAGAHRICATPETLPAVIHQARAER